MIRGGALAYRAQGAPKGQQFGANVGEIQTLRDPMFVASQVFGSLTDDVIRNQISKIDPAALQSAPPQIRAILEERLANMQNFSSGLLPGLENLTSSAKWKPQSRDASRFNEAGNKRGKTLYRGSPRPKVWRKGQIFHHTFLIL